MIVCVCKSVNERRIREVVAQGATSFKQVAQTTGACTQCGKCASAVAACIPRRDTQAALRPCAA